MNNMSFRFGLDLFHSFSKKQRLCFILGCLTSLFFFSFVHAKNLSGSVEAEISMTGEYGQESKSGTFTSYTLEPSWSVRPTLDWGLNDFVSIGGELGLSWMSVDKNLFNDQRRQKITPMLRLRMDFPINCRLILEGVFAGGFGVLSELRGVSVAQGGDRLWGGGFRMHFGLRYLVNTQVHLLLGAGYEQIGFSGEEVEVDLISVPVVFGVRGQF